MPPSLLQLKSVSVQMFFDRRAVTSRVDASTRRLLSKAGAYVRRRARSSIRKSDRISKPGHLPKSHAGTLRNLIWFGYDPSEQTVIVGPAASGRRSHGRVFTDSSVPATLEFGGYATIIKANERQGRQRFRVKIAARPFMGPALRKEAHKFPKLWANSVK